MTAATIISEASLQRALIHWISTTLSEKAPQAKQLDLSNLREAKLMLAERVEQWKAEYRQEGRQEGLQEGFLQGAAKIFSKQAELKFGTLSAETAAKIQQADEATLTRWAERLLSANTLAELFTD